MFLLFVFKCLWIVSAGGANASLAELKALLCPQNVFVNGEWVLHVCTHMSTPGRTDACMYTHMDTHTHTHTHTHTQSGMLQWCVPGVLYSLSWRFFCCSFVLFLVCVGVCVLCLILWVCLWVGCHPACVKDSILFCKGFLSAKTVNKGHRVIERKKERDCVFVWHVYRKQGHFLVQACPCFWKGR